MPVFGAAKILERAKMWETTAALAQKTPAQGALKALIAPPKGWKKKRYANEDLARALGYTAQFLWDQRVTRPLQPSATHQAQMLVLASALSHLVHPDKSQLPEGNTRYNDRARVRLSQWFWAATFSGHRPGESKLAAERTALVDWALGGSDAAAPTVVALTPPGSDDIVAWRFGTWRHRAVTALLAHRDPADLLTGERIAAQQAFEGSIDGHHLFPRGWAKDTGRDPAEVDVAVNTAALTGYTNRWIRKRAPSEYLGLLREQIGPARLSGILEQHLIPEAAMQADDWPAFRAARADSIQDLIAKSLRPT